MYCIMFLHSIFLNIDNPPFYTEHLLRIILAPYNSTTTSSWWLLEAEVPKVPAGVCCVAQVAVSLVTQGGEGGHLQAGAWAQQSH